MSADSLATALEAIGVHCRVEDQGKLAVLVMTSELPSGPRARRSIVALGRSHGFSNVCVELESIDAALPGD